MRPKVLWAAASVFTLLAGCVGEHDHFYTLSVLPTTRQGALSAPVKHAILSVTIPSLADRSEMIVQNGDHGIEVLDHRRWGEPLADQISQTLARDLEQRRSDLLIGGRGFDQPGDPPLKIRIDIVRLSASMGGQASIEAHWRIEGGTLDVLGGDSFSTSIKGSNFDALAVAYSEGLAKLADELAPLLPR